MNKNTTAEEEKQSETVASIVHHHNHRVFTTTTYIAIDSATASCRLCSASRSSSVFCGAASRAARMDACVIKVACGMCVGVLPKRQER